MNTFYVKLLKIKIMNTKLLFILSVLILFTSNGRAQMYTIDKIFLPATGMEVCFHIDSEKSKYVYYDMKNEDSSEKALARLSTSEIKSFITSLKKAKTKYEEWSRIAKEEGTLAFSKRIPQSFRDQDIYFTDKGKWFREKGVDMNTLMSIDNYGNCYLTLQSDYMQCEEAVGETSMVGGSYAPQVNVGSIFGSSSQMVVKHTCQGASLTFNSSSQIDSFIDCLLKVSDWKNKNNSQNNKFK